MTILSKEKRVFCPEKYYVQPRTLSAVHEFKIDPAEFDKPVTTFESAKKLISDFVRLEVYHFELAAVNPLGQNATLDKHWKSYGNNKTMATFNVENIDASAFKRNKCIVFQPSSGPYFTANVEELNDKKLTVKIVDVEKFENHKHKPLNIHSLVNYHFFANQLHSLERIAANRDTIRKLVYETPVIDKDNTAFDNKFGRMNLPAALNFPTLSEEQEFAINQMTRHSNSTFVLAGATGTGKSVALLKTVLQLVQAGGRVLITTTSNHPADAFTQGLVNHGFADKNKILRLVKGIHELESLSEEAKALARQEVPKNVDEIVIVIVTVGYAFKLEDKVAFSHIIVEDANEVPEVDIWTCLSHYGYRKETRLILSGDPELPGPHSVVSSQCSMKTFFKRPMITRLMGNDNFKQHRELMVELKQNHRSHPDIVNTLQKLGYGSSVFPSRAHDSVEACKALLTGYPIMFCNVEKADDGNGNRAEVAAVAKYVEMLKDKIPENEIGILAADRCQETLLKQMLTTGIKIGTCFAFRGIDRQVILFSAKCCGDNQDHLTEPGLINLILSRATDLVVIIGNAACLEKLDEWKRLINICKENNTFREGSIQCRSQGVAKGCNATIEALARVAKLYATVAKLLNQAGYGTGSITLPVPQSERSVYTIPQKRLKRTPSVMSQRETKPEQTRSSEAMDKVLSNMQTLSLALQCVISNVNEIAEAQKNVVHPKDYERGRSIVIFGIPESRSPTPSARTEFDRRKITELFDVLNIESTPTAIYRSPMEPPIDPRSPPRRLTVVFSNDRDRGAIFGNRHKLKDHPAFGKISIQPVRTKEEIQHHKQCEHIKKQIREHENIVLTLYRDRLCKFSGNIRQAEQLTREQFLELCEKYPLPELRQPIYDDSESDYD